jgi:hypothetical protein
MKFGLYLEIALRNTRSKGSATRALMRHGGNKLERETFITKYLYCLLEFVCCVIV